MRALRRAWRRLAGTLSGTRRERELADELALHLALQTEDNLKLGMTPEQARRAALLKLGGLESVKESVRDQRGLPALEGFGRDARQAFRSLRRSPEFSAAGIASLALGIGAATAIFSVTDAMLLRSLPYAQPDRLATISAGGAVSAPLYELFRSESRSLERAALFAPWTFTLAGAGEPERIPGARVSADTFALLGVAPRLGRVFSAAEDQKGSAAVVVLGDGLWKRRFGGDPAVVGRTVVLDDTPYTVLGVMPPGFRFPEGPEHHATAGPFPPAELWRPMALADWERTCGGCFNFGMLARLRPGVTGAAASAELAGILERHAPPHSRDRAADVAVVRLQDAITRQVRAPLLILLGAVTLALLIACVNVANLLLARGLRRRQELAVRLALGASRIRLAQQGFTEALALALCGAALAVPVAWAGLRGLAAIAPPGLPRVAAAGIDVRMLAFALSLALLTSLLFGVAPALLAAQRAPGDALPAGARATAAGSVRLRAALVAGEFALSLVLLAGAGLLARSFVTVSRIPLGFEAENVLTAPTSLPAKRYDDRRRAALVERLVANCAALPGVTSAAAVSTLPLTGESEGWGLVAADNPHRDDYIMARVRAVSPDYFRTLGIRLRAGRVFTSRDRGAAPVAVISETAARRLWPGVANPLGRRLLGEPSMTVVGIVEDTHASGLDAEVRPYLYLPFWQFAPEDFALAVRSASDPAALARAVKAEVWRIDKDQPVTHVAVLRQLVADSIAPRRFQATVMALFAGFAVLLAAVGIYGVLSYSVAQRIQEIGIRIALGASRAQIIGGILRQAGVLALAGATLGLATAFRLEPLLRAVLYGTTGTGAAMFLGCAALLLAVAVAAAVVPARRAARLDPAGCLRYE